MGAVIGSRISASSRAPRGRWRWLRGGGALLASAVVHAAAAVTVGGVLARGSRSGDRAAQMVELDLAPSELAANLPMAAAAPPMAAASEPIRAHPAPRRRLPMRPAPLSSTEASPVPQNPGAPLTAAAPRFAMSAGTVATRATAPAVERTMPSGPKGTADSTGSSAAFGEGDVNEPARLLVPSPLVYPPAARAAQIEVDVPVEIIVDTTGRVVAATGLRHAGYGLDEAALRAIRDYRFSPARRQGRSVPVRMRWILQFRLR